MTAPGLRFGRLIWTIRPANRAALFSYARLTRRKIAAGYTPTMTTQPLISHHSTSQQDPARAEQQRLALLYNVGERQMLHSYRLAARQVVTRQHVLVDGRLASGPYRRLRPGQKITLHPRKRQELAMLQWSEPPVTPPDYLDVNFGALTAVLLRLPRRDEIPVPVDESLVARYYAALL